MDTNQQTPSSANVTPEGYEAREVVWPGTGERFMALFPKQVEYSFES